MNELTFYLLKMVAGSGVMYLGYRLWLGNNHVVGMIRWYLIASLIIPALLPLVSFPVSQEFDRLPVVRVAVMPEIQVVADGSGAGAAPVPFSPSTIVYTLVCGVLFLIFVARLFSIIRLIRRSETVRYRRFRLHLSTFNLSPFSFFNNILISDARARQGKLKPIIVHEAAHIRQGHSYDIVFSEFMCMLQWFNPFVWLFRNAIRQNHEFLADRAVVKQQCNPAGYKALLLESLTGISIPVVNNFNHSSLKKRFIMLNKPVSGRGAHVRTLAIVLMLVTIVSAVMLMVQKETFALTPGNLSGYHPQTAATLPPVVADGTQTPYSGEQIPDTASGKDEVFMVVEKMPEFPGGESAMTTYLSASVKYPAEARKKGIEGTVMLQYVIEADGLVSNVKVLRSVEPSCDEAACKAVREMPRWMPGMQRGKAVRVQMQMPVKFALQKEKSKKGAEEATVVAADDNTVFTIVESMPQFPGGEEARMKYLAANITYPESARKAGKQGLVYIQFVVEPDGRITDTKVLRGFDRACDSVAVSVISKMPVWKPGRLHDKPVRVQFNMPVKFTLTKDKGKGNSR